MSELPPAVRNLFRDRSVYRQNVRRADTEAEKEDYANQMIARGEATMSDWAAAAIGKPLISAQTYPLEVSENVFEERYRDDVTGEVLWDKVRDTLHEERFADEFETTTKAANAAGCIRRFTFEADEGDIVILNTPMGQMIAVYDSPAMYDPDMPNNDYPEDHVFRRDIRFVRGDDREPLTFDTQQLPKPLKPNQQAITEVSRDGLETLLTHAEVLTELTNAPSTAE